MTKTTITLDPDMRVRRAARIILSSVAKLTFSRMAAAEAGEAEAGIHQMRVAAKRLRESMRLFQPIYHRSEFKAILTLVDELNDHLGAVRDQDVLIEHVGLLGEPDVPFLRDLVAFLEARREQQQAALNVELAKLREDRLPERLAEIIVNGRHGKGHEVAGQRCRPFARAVISVRLDKVIGRLKAVEGEHDATGLHRVRVANKQLRYAMEPFVPIFDRRIEMAYHRVSELHTTLGDLHDLDVLRDTVNAFALDHNRVPEARPRLGVLQGIRRREYGRALTFFSEGSELTFVRLVADAID